MFGSHATQKDDCNLSSLLYLLYTNTSVSEVDKLIHWNIYLPPQLWVHVCLIFYTVTCWM